MMDLKPINLVFCEECYFYKHHYDIRPTCEAPQNTEIKMRWNKMQKTYIKRPWKINEQNSCDWFETIESHRPKISPKGQGK